MDRMINRRPSVRRRVERHPMYGAVPLIRESYGWRYDPDFKPRLPNGAVVGDVSKQDFCPLHHAPKYFYVDERRNCIQCSRDFVFRAAEQKHWYETLKFNFHSVPVRCPDCRRRRRSEHALREQIARAKVEIRQRPTDAAAHLALARAIVQYHERTQKGNLDEAIAAARKAGSLLRQAKEPAFWEGLAHVEAGRPAKARQSFERFLSHGGLGHQQATLVRIARDYLEGLRG